MTGAEFARDLLINGAEFAIKRGAPFLANKNR